MASTCGKPSRTGQQGYAELVAGSFRATRTREALERIVRLYEISDHLAPGIGKAARAAAWRAKLETWRATTQPADT